MIRALGGYLTRVLRALGGFDVTHELDSATPCAASYRALGPAHHRHRAARHDRPRAARTRPRSGARPAGRGASPATRTVDYAVSAPARPAAEFLQKPLTADDLLPRPAGWSRRAGRRGRGRETVLAIGAHPDDVEIGAAGTLLAHRAAGHTVAILTMSRGRPRRRQGPRARESQEAADDHRRRALPGGPGGHPDRRGQPDDQRHRGPSRRVQPTDHLHPLRPRRPPGPPQHPPGGHGRLPRASAGLLLPVAVGHRGLPPGPLRHHRRAPRGKLKADRRVRLAGRVRDYLEPDLIAATARYWSRFGGGSHAEAFEVVRDQPRRPRPLPAEAPRWRNQATQPRNAAHQIERTPRPHRGRAGHIRPPHRAAAARPGHRRRRPGRHRGDQVAARRPRGRAAGRRHGSVGRRPVPGPARGPDADPGRAAPEFTDLLLARCLDAGRRRRHPDRRRRAPAAGRRPRRLRARPGIDLLLAPAAALDIILDKLALAGPVPVSSASRAPSPSEPASTRRSWTIPVVVKPRTGSGSRGVMHGGLRRRTAALEPLSRLIVQEFLPGEEYSVDVLADADGHVIASVPAAAGPGRLRRLGGRPHGARP